MGVDITFQKYVNLSSKNFYVDKYFERKLSSTNTLGQINVHFSRNDLQ